MTTTALTKPQELIKLEADQQGKCTFLEVGDEGEYCRKGKGIVFTCKEWLDPKSPYYTENCPDKECGEE